MDQECRKVMTKTFCYFGIFALASLGLLYANQEKILYMPGAPIRFINENPEGYRSP